MTTCIIELKVSRGGWDGCLALGSGLARGSEHKMFFSGRGTVNGKKDGEIPEKTDKTRVKGTKINN